MHNSFSPCGYMLCFINNRKVLLNNWQQTVHHPVLRTLLDNRPLVAKAFMIINSLSFSRIFYTLPPLNSWARKLKPKVINSVLVHPECLKSLDQFGNYCNVKLGITNAWILLSGGVYVAMQLIPPTFIWTNAKYFYKAKYTERQAV